MEIYSINKEGKENMRHQVIPDGISGDSWAEYRNLIISELRRLNSGLEGIREELGKVHVDIATLKVKATGWGVLGGGIAVLITLAVAAVSWLLKK